MERLSFAGLYLLFWLMFVQPWMAVRSGRRLAKGGIVVGGEGPSAVSRSRLWSGTLANLMATGLLAVLVGRTFEYPFLAVEALGLREVGLGVGALLLCVALSRAGWAFRSEEERRRLPTLAWAPRTRREWGLFALVATAAGFAEELAYRGVGMAVLTWATGDAWASAALLSAAFAVAHWAQGWLSRALILLVALLMHTLVALTDTLLVAIVVHIVYDLWAGWRTGRQAAYYEAEASARAPAPSP